MSWEDLVNELHKLNRAEKLRAMQILVNDLAEEETLIARDTEYPIYTPLGNAAAAEVLLKMLEEDRMPH